ncbi:hypothetical protein BGZ49_001760 [Haplosporangium sp. Z 27]|nr:hypothetical protein BGZ49_001760 [Haplosporangium sp. Z 27]
MNTSYSAHIKTIGNENSVAHKQLTSAYEGHIQKHGATPSLDQLFDHAREASSSEHDKDVLNWLQSVVSAKISQPGGAEGEIFVSPVFFPSEDSFQHLLDTIHKAQRSLDICVYTITDNEIANAVIKAHERGVRVRIITDDEKVDDLGSDIRRLAGQGDIPVRMDNTPAFMHHKFVIVDDALVANGSYNWTKGARFHNREDLSLTNSAKAVHAFKQEFEKLWTEFEHFKVTA